jgi:hypothetical protein
MTSLLSALPNPASWLRSAGSRFTAPSAKWIPGALMLLLATPYSETSHACMTLFEFEIEVIAHADAVFVGELVKFEVMKPKAKDYPEYAVLTFVVEEYLGGEMSEKRIEAEWDNYPYGTPPELKPDRYLVAVVEWRASKGTKSASRHLVVLSDPCRPPFILEPTEQNLEQVKSLLKEGKKKLKSLLKEREKKR